MAYPVVVSTVSDGDDVIVSGSRPPAELPGLL
jgi:hypothetical protein